MPLRPRRSLAVVPVLALVATMLGLGAAPAMAAPPSNDQLSGATPLTFTTVGDIAFAEATRDDPGEPVPTSGDCNRNNRTVWFSFTADKSRKVRLETSTGDTVVALYSGPATGATYGGLQEVGCSDDVAPSGPFTSRLVTDVTAGTTYYVQLGAFSAAATFTTNLTFAIVPPANDNLVVAAPLVSGLTQVNNADATLESGEPTGQTGCDQLNSSVWYTFTPGANGDRTFETSGPSGGDTVVRLYTGPTSSPTTASLMFVGCDDDGGTGTYSQLSRTVTAGTTYYVQVGTFRSTPGGNDPGPGPFALIFRDPATDPPINDTPAGATAVSVAASTGIGTFSTTTLNATETPGEPSPAPGTRTVWLTWAAPYPGQARLDTTSSQPERNTYLCVFPATGPVTPATALVCNDDVAPGMDVRSAIQFDVTAATTYRILVGTHPGDAGDVVTGTLAYQPPANDDRLSPPAITGATGSTPGYHRFATAQAGDPDLGIPAAGSRSVWWSYTPATTGGMVFETAAPTSTTETVLAVYEVAGGMLTQVALNDDIDEGSMIYLSRVDFRADVSKTYLVRVDGYSASSANPFTLQWHPYVGEATTTTPTFVSSAGATVTYTLAATPEDGSSPYSFAGRFDVRRLGSPTVLSSVDTLDGTATVAAPLQPGSNTFEFAFVPTDYHLAGSDGQASYGYTAPSDPHFVAQSAGSLSVALEAAPTPTGAGTLDPAATGNLFFTDENGAVGGGALIEGVYGTEITATRGTHSYSVSFASSDARLADSTAGPVQVAVVDGTSTTLTSAVSGTKVTLTGTVTPDGGGAAATGSVEFFEGAVSRGSATLAAGAGSLVLNGVAPGAHTYRAVFTPAGADLVGSTSANVAATVAKLASKTKVTGPKQVTAGARPTVVVKVTIGSAKATGKVTIFLNGKKLKQLTLKNGVVSYKLPTLKPGTAKVKATYAGSKIGRGSTFTLPIAVRR